MFFFIEKYHDDDDSRGTVGRPLKLKKQIKKNMVAWSHEKLTLNKIQTCGMESV